MIDHRNEKLTLPDHSNFVPFGKMRYLLFDINFINIHEHNLHMICISIFLFVSE